MFLVFVTMQLSLSNANLHLWSNTSASGSSMFAISSACWLHECFSTSGANMVLDAVVPLQVNHQRGSLDEALLALVAMIIFLSTVNLLMVGSHGAETESLFATLLSTGEALFTGVLCHVPLQVVLVGAFLPTLCTHVDAVAVSVVLVVLK